MIESVTRDGRDPQGWHAAPLRQGMIFLCIVTSLYALLAGLRTLTDYDLGWQMATARWVVQHHQISSIDVLSYTAKGQPWVYPVGAGLLFYLLFSIGKYSLLSWFGALVCVSTTAILLRPASLISCALTLLAVPLIALRTAPRAEMFSVLLFATFLSVLWTYYTQGRERLWLLPMLMVLWVNLHLGFIAGLGLAFAYVLLEATDWVSPERRFGASQRLRKAWPWLGLTILATILNPWGWSIFGALLRQDQAMAQHAQTISEWATTPLNWTILCASLSLRNAEGAFFVLLVIAALAVLSAILQKQLGAALLLSAAALLSLRHARLQVFCAAVVVVVGSTMLRTAIVAITNRLAGIPSARFAFQIAAILLLTTLAVLRSSDVVTNRAYFRATSLATFGTGLSWWFPEGGVSFIEAQAVPGNLMNDYNEGGFVIWRLGAEYPDYIDSRAIPFGPERMARAGLLMASGPDSMVWQEEANRYNINVILVAIGRYDGLQFFPALKQFCTSQSWRPVYLDESSAVFVRVRPETKELIERNDVDCATARLPTRENGSRAELFNRRANAAAILQALGRYREALISADSALTIFPECAFLHFIKGTIYEQTNQWKIAEKELREATELQPVAVAPWATLASFYRRHGQVEKAIQTGEHAAALSPRPWGILLELSYTYLDARRPAEALDAFDRSAASLGAHPLAVVDKSFLASIAHGRAVSFDALGNLPQAVAYEEETVRLAPQNRESWQQLAMLYERLGRFADAQRAVERANRLPPSS